MPVPVYLEVGSRRVFACAVEWPGWCRAGRTEAAALGALAGAAARYAAVVPELDVGVSGDVDVIGTLPGDASTDFGVPGAIGEWDRVEIDAAGRAWLASIVGRCWEAFDRAVAAAPAVLTKGPRGGGRDRDAIVEHVRDAERAYGPKLGHRMSKAAPWPEQRARLLDGLRHPEPTARWPVRYAARRLAWHTLDHLWELEDRTPPAGRPH